MLIGQERYHSEFLLVEDDDVTVRGGVKHARYSHDCTGLCAMSACCQELCSLTHHASQVAADDSDEEVGGHAALTVSPFLAQGNASVVQKDLQFPKPWHSSAACLCLRVQKNWLNSERASLGHCSGAYLGNKASASHSSSSYRSS